MQSAPGSSAPAGRSVSSRSTSTISRPSTTGFGHLAGDVVLRTVARAIRDAVRADDSVYRYGGEEFVVLLRETKGGVGLAGDRVRRAVERLGTAHPDNQPFGVVTVSVGAAEFGPLDLAENAEEWFARVDTALYAAKHAGRNRVAVATEPADTSLPVAVATRT